jgi:hypothetical protein
MGKLAARVDVDKARFQLMPPAFMRRAEEIADPELDAIRVVYDACYNTVFGEKVRTGNFFKHKHDIIDNVRRAGVSMKMFLLANMLGWKETHPGSDFMPQVLSGTYAVDRVKKYSAECYRRYGTFDQLAVDQLKSSDTAREDFDAIMLNSEITAGAWVVNFSILNSAPVAKKLYAERETALNPHWLAIEPSYSEYVLDDYVLSKQDCEAFLKKHRWNTLQIIGKMKKNVVHAIAIFSSRERIMPEAVRRVLQQRGLRPEHFQIDRTPVVEPIKFWKRLGTAIQQFECLNFVDGYDSVFDRQFTQYRI